MSEEEEGFGADYDRMVSQFEKLQKQANDSLKANTKELGHAVAEAV